MFKTYRNLKSLHSLYEQNFILVNKLSGELDKHNKFSFQVGSLEIKSQVNISKKSYQNLLMNCISLSTMLLG